MAEAEAATPLADLSVDLPVLHSEVVFDGRIWDVRREAVEYDGEQLVRDFVAHPGAVGVLAVDDDDRIVLIRQYRHPIRSRNWEIPAGLRDLAGEDPLDTAKRELAEEVDLVAADWSLLVDFHTTPGGSDETIRIYLARGLAEAPQAFAREGEEADMEVRRVPLDECVDAVLEGRLRNGPLAVAVLAAAAARGRRTGATG
ncbi:NUDIX domain-containing protein [Agromyces sp. MMS24-JH15]|uniref:NUDIX domain-containing protein n=1 Tax=Agromyces sp. MMS24-JH15 TaxID=3243765 RepID=UPI003749D4C4